MDGKRLLWHIPVCGCCTCIYISDVPYLGIISNYKKFQKEKNSFYFISERDHLFEIIMVLYIYSTTSVSCEPDPLPANS